MSYILIFICIFISHNGTGLGCFHLKSLELTQKQFSYFARCLSSVCCSVTSEQDAVSKLHRCVVKINMKAELEDR